MTKITAAITRVGQAEFTVVSVPPGAVSTTAAAERVIAGLRRYFPGRPIALAARVGRRTTYVGRPDITRFLTNIAPAQLPWKTYTFTD